MKPSHNIELKARCDDLNAARYAAEALGAIRTATLEQTDTYFQVARGRLKLREIRGQGSELIWYEREDRAEARSSRYTIVPVGDSGSMKLALEGANGVRAVVKKTRELWLWHNVRIHLDDVAGLGTFLEFEAVQGPGEDETVSRERVAQLSEALRIGEIVPQSYVDLV